MQYGQVQYQNHKRQQFFNKNMSWPTDLVLQMLENVGLIETPSKVTSLGF